MKIKSVVKSTIIILGGITAIVLMYMLIFQKKPINIDSDDVTKIAVYISEFGEEETYYWLEFSDKGRIEGLVGEMNDIRARKVSEEIETGDYANVSMEIAIYGKKPSSHCEIRIRGNGFISMYEGAEGDLYKMSDKICKEFYKYVKNLCVSDENCEITYE